MNNHSQPLRPLIGITPDSEERPASEESREQVILLRDAYTRALLNAGAIPFILPIVTSPAIVHSILERLDGIVVSGGNFDIDPKYYGESSTPALGALKEARTVFELEVISWALKQDIPLLGICGGAQALNVALGGSLYQDITTEILDAGEHQRGALREGNQHRIEIVEGTKLRQIVERSALEVNTTHHQAVKRLGTRLITNAMAEDGVIEGIESPDHLFVLGVQWHPERLTESDLAQKKIFTAFVQACSEIAEQQRRK